MKRMTSCII